MNRILIPLIALLLMLAPLTAQADEADFDSGVWKTSQEVISGLEMIGFLRDYVETSEPWSDYEVSAEILRVPPDLRLNPGERSVIVRRMRPGDFTTIANLRLEVQVGGVTYKSFGVAQYLDLRAPLATATRRLKRGEHIGPADVRTERVSLRDVGQGEPFTGAEELIGMKAITTIQPGTPVTTRQIDLPWALKRNDPVNIRVRRGALTVICKGKALENGRIGQTVRVENKQSGKIVEALVTGRGAVSLDL